MAGKQQNYGPAPAVQPACKVAEREKDRWWGGAIRDPSWCA